MTNFTDNWTREKQREYNKQWRKKNKDYFKKWREKNPNYFKDWVEKNKDKIKVYEKNKVGNKQFLEYKRKYYWSNKKTRIKARARASIRNQVTARRIKKEPCEKCGNIDSEAHHEDYSKALEVNWLCKECHKKLHAKIKPSIYR